MVTGGFDNECILKNRELDEKCEEELGIATGVQAYQIFGKSLMQDFGENQVCAVTVPRVPCCLRHPHLLPRVNTLPLLSQFSSTLDLEVSPTSSLRQMGCMLGIYSHSRVIWVSNSNICAYGLKQPTRYVIGRLLWCIDLTCVQLDCYNVCVSTTALKRHLTRSGYLRQDGDRLLATFSSHNTDAPLPDRQFLTLHAVCARVAHMSGAIQIIDKSELDVEDTKVFASDGLSADLLDHHMAFAAAPEVL